MKNQDFKIDKITVAVTNADQMVAFYKTVFKCEFKEIEGYGVTRFSGKLGDIKLLLCPNTLADVKAEQNRQQFEFVVSDLNKIIQDAKVAGGKIQGEIEMTEKQKLVCIIDPDGNTIIFIQAL